MSNRVVVPELVTKARENMGLSIRGFIKSINKAYSVATQSYIEAGRYRPGLETREILLAGLKVTEEDITLPLSELKTRKTEYPKFFAKGVK